MSDLEMLQKLLNNQLGGFSNSGDYDKMDFDVKRDGRDKKIVTVSSLEVGFVFEHDALIGAFNYKQ